MGGMHQHGILTLWNTPSKAGILEKKKVPGGFKNRTTEGERDEGDHRYTRDYRRSKNRIDDKVLGNALTTAPWGRMTGGEGERSCRKWSKK